MKFIKAYFSGMNKYVDFYGTDPDVGLYNGIKDIGISIMLIMLLHNLFATIILVTIIAYDSAHVVKCLVVINKLTGLKPVKNCEVTEQQVEIYKQMNNMDDNKSAE